MAAGLVAVTTMPIVLGLMAVLVAAAATVYRLALGLAILAFTYPFDLTTYAGPVKLTTSAVLMAILGTVLIARLIWTNEWHWHSTELDLPVLAFVVATLLSTLGMAGYWEDQMVGLLKALGGFVMFVLAAQALRTRVDVWVVVGAILATASLQAVMLTWQILTGMAVVSEDTRAIGTVDDPNLFAGYLVLVVPLALAVGISFRTWWAMAGTGMVTIALAFAVIATLSRSGWIGALVGVGIVALVLRERRWAVVAMAGGIAVVAVLIFLAPISQRLSPHVWGPGEMLSVRTDIWLVAVTVAIHHPVFGVGVANFVNYYPQFGGTTQGINHTHNLLLNMFTERGALGLLTFAVIPFVLFKSLLANLSNAGDRLDRAIICGLAGSFGGYLVHSLVEVSYYDYKVLLLFWLLAGVVAALGRLMKSGRRTFAESSRQYEALG